MGKGAFLLRGEREDRGVEAGFAASDAIEVEVDVFMPAHLKHSQKQFRKLRAMHGMS